jgi:carboxypeptidase Taq
MRAYDDLAVRFRRRAAIEEAAGMLHWDTATLMPSGGAEARGEQLAALNVVSHQMLADPMVAGLLDEADDQAGSIDPWQAANLREMRRCWLHAAAVDADLVAAETKAANACEMVWREARPKGDFGLVAPALKTLLSLVREVAAAKAEVLACSPYDALLDLYEPGGSSARIDECFAELAGFLPGILEDVLAHQARRPKALVPAGPFPLDRQEALVRELMTRVGFDFNHGRLDVSLHPFCGGVPDDVRITTRYDEGDFMKALMGVLHETGHALYERGLPSAWRLQPVGAARGMALHESQSLLIEMQTCRSAEFVSFMAPQARRTFAGEGPAWETANLARLVNQVEPGFIRVDADEVTYPLHVILRYRLERALIVGEMEVEDLPAAWNAGMVELLGLSPGDDGEGCLQDIHWYSGLWGYFPTYTLGAMMAAQLFAAAKRQLPNVMGDIAEGNFARLLGFLGAEVHSRGSSLSSEEILRQATGSALDVEVFKAHLRTRYLPSD